MNIQWDDDDNSDDDGGTELFFALSNMLTFFK